MTTPTTDKTQATRAATATPSTTAWTIDASHAEIGFAVRHLMIATVRGRFAGVAGTVTADEKNPLHPSIDVEIDVNTVDTRQPQRDAHLRSADFFDVEKFPTMHFKGGTVDGDVNGTFTLTGDLTIRGVTKPVTLEVTAEGRVRDPWGGERVGFSARGKVNRGEFGLTWNQVLEAGGVTVGDEVRLSIDVELVRQEGASAAA